MDVDSTFVQAEVINELAALVGCEAEVAEITERAMRGELDFEQALGERVKLLKGLPIEKAKSVIDQIELTPGAGQFVRTLKSLGYRVGLVSGGFDFFVDELKARFGLDFAFANELEVVDGKLSGKVQGTVLDASRKAQLLKDMAKVYKCRLQQTIAIGDGANDIHMLQTAGMGISYHGKPRLQEIADMSLNHHSSMEKLLLLMGYHAGDLKVLTDGNRLG
jgi:phosphoserine phosphatase